MRQFKDIPPNIARLPRDPRGFPIPYFAVKGDFRVVSAERMALAIKKKTCWVCGKRIKANYAFVIGPMCAINRTISDPPSHQSCAKFSARYCPFLSRPMAKRNTSTPLPDVNGTLSAAAGHGLQRNPKACAVWVTKSYKTFTPPGGGTLFSIGDPVRVLWYASGRAATRAEVDESIETGVPHLREMCDLDGPAAHIALDAAIARVQDLLPAAA